MAEEVFMSMTENLISVNRIRVDSIDLYEITGDELDTIENGSQESIYLNFAVAFVSIFISALLSLLTATFNFESAKIITYCVLVISFVCSAIFTILWLRYRKDSRNVFFKIRNRLSNTKAISDIPVPPGDTNSSEA